MYPAGVPRYGDLSRMSFSPNMPGISTGNIMIDMALSSMMGNRNFSAIPGQGQGVYDAYLTQQRSKQFIQSMQHGFGNSLMFQKLGGLSGGASGQMATMLLGQPDGLMNTPFFRAMNGGNPVKQMMSLNAGMTGQTMNMAYGGPANATFNQVKAAFDGQNSAMFTQKLFQQKDYDKAHSYSSNQLANNLTSSTAGAGLFGDLITKGKDGAKSFDYAKFEKNAEKYANLAKKSGDQAVIDAYNKAYDSTKGLVELRGKIGTNVQDKVDFSTTRGFESQDINSALLMGKDLGMVFSKNRFVKDAEPTEKDIRDTEKNATKNVAVLMDAMKDLTGTGDATGLMGEINSLVGNGQLNLGNSSQTKDMEKLLREFKGAARAAGVSVETVLGIQAVSKELAARLPQLSNRSGTALMASNISAIQSTSALTSQLGPDWVRAQGGQAKLLETMSVSNIMATDELPIKSAAGMSALIKGAKNISETDRTALLDDLQKSMESGALVDPAGLIGMRSRIANKLGMSDNQVLMNEESGAMQRTGFAGMEEDRIQNKRKWDIEGAMGATTVADMDKLAEFTRVNPNDYASFKKDIMAGKNWDLAISENNLGQFAALESRSTDDIYKMRYTEQLLKTDPNSAYVKERKALELSGNSYAKDATEFAKRGGALKASFGSAIMQEILGGNFEHGISELTKTFTNSDARVRGDAVLRAARNVADEGTTLSVKEAMLEAGGGLNVSSTDELRKNLKTMGYTDEAIDLKVKQHEKMYNDEEWENMDNIGSLSMQEILNASKSDDAWDRSRAKASGFDKAKVIRGAKFLNETGMSTSAAKYGRQSWNQSKGGMAINAGVDAASKMAADEQIKDINATTDVNFEKQMKDLYSSDSGEFGALAKSIHALGPDLIKNGGHDIDTAEVMKRAFAAEDPSKPDSPERKAAKEKLQKNAVLASAHANIDEVTKTANSAGDSAEKLMIDEFGKLSKQIGDSSGSIATAINQLVTMLGSFGSVS